MTRVVRASTLGAATLLALVGSARLVEARLGASLTGQWAVTISTERGDMNTVWDLVQHDDRLTGTIEGRRGAADAEGGWVENDTFGFTVQREFQGQSFKIEYEGRITEDALEGTLTAGGGQFTAGFTGVRAGGETR